MANADGAALRIADALNEAGQGPPRVVGLVGRLEHVAVGRRPRALEGALREVEAASDPIEFGHELWELGQLGAAWAILELGAAVHEVRNTVLEEQGRLVRNQQQSLPEERRLNIR
eukprot:4118384-Alexandrium_andersonii.AAC.1